MKNSQIRLKNQEINQRQKKLRKLCIQTKQNQSRRTLYSKLDQPIKGQACIATLYNQDLVKFRKIGIMIFATNIDNFVYQQLQSYKYILQMNDIIDGKILRKYEIIKKIGKGAYGQVWKVINKKGSIKTYNTVREKDHQNNDFRALKKVCDCFRNVVDCQRTFRQIAYLQKLNHSNIIKMLSYERSTNDKDVYIEMQCMQSDLSTVLKNGYLNDLQKKYIFVQVVSALYYLHTGQLIHRDIKPSNILVGASCQAKLCDFGLIRSLDQQKPLQQQQLSQNIATRWYKAPQLLLGSCTYDKSVDIWGLGCVLGEIMLGRPLFQGTSTFNQLQKIMQYIQKPKNISLFIKSQTAIAIFDSISSPNSKDQNNINLKKLLPNIDTVTLDLLKGLLKFDPKSRLTIEQVIIHPYISQKNKYTQKIKFTKAEAPIKVDGDISLNDIPYQVPNSKYQVYHTDKSPDKMASKNKSGINYFKGLLFDSQMLKIVDQPQTNGSEASENKLNLHYPKKIIGTCYPQKKQQEIKSKEKDKSSKSGLKQKISIGTKTTAKKMGSRQKVDTIQQKKSISKQTIKVNKSNEKSAKSIGQKSNNNDLSKSKKKMNLNQMIEKQGKQIKQSEVLNKYKPSPNRLQTKKVIQKKQDKNLIFKKQVTISRGYKNDKSAKKDASDNSDIDKVSQKSKVSNIPKNNDKLTANKNNMGLRSSQDRKFLTKYHTSPQVITTTVTNNTKNSSSNKMADRKVVVEQKKVTLKKIQQPKSQKLISYKTAISDQKMKSQKSNNSSSNLSQKNISQYQNNSRFLYFPDQYIQKKKANHIDTSDKNKSGDSRQSQNDIYGSIQLNKARNFRSPVVKRNQNLQTKIKVESDSFKNNLNKKKQGISSQKDLTIAKNQQEDYAKKILKQIPGLKYLSPQNLQNQQDNGEFISNQNIVQPKNRYRNSHNNYYQSNKTKNIKVQQNVSKISITKNNQKLTQSQEYGKATTPLKFDTVKQQKIKEQKYPIIKKQIKIQDNQNGYKFKTIGMVSKYPQIRKY